MHFIALLSACLIITALNMLKQCHFQGSVATVFKKRWTKL